MIPDIAATSPPAGPKDFVELLQAYPHETQYNFETDYTYVTFRTINRMFRYRHNMQEFTEVDWKTKEPIPSVREEWAAKHPPGMKGSVGEGSCPVQPELAAPGLHPTTFEYLKPTDEQLKRMTSLRNTAKYYAHVVDSLVPAGPDKTYALRKIREIAMWVNVAVTRQTDGTPRDMKKRRADRRNHGHPILRKRRRAPGVVRRSIPHILRDFAGGAAKMREDNLDIFTYMILAKYPALRQAFARTRLTAAAPAGDPAG